MYPLFDFSSRDFEKMLLWENNGSGLLSTSAQYRKIIKQGKFVGNKYNSPWSLATFLFLDEREQKSDNQLTSSAGKWAHSNMQGMRLFRLSCWLCCGSSQHIKIAAIAIDCFVLLLWWVLKNRLSSLFSRLCICKLLVAFGAKISRRVSLWQFLNTFPTHF